ncbi:MAG TPA: sigma-70 family RNA polymerase sigma factor [Pirellulales bacterium]|nr:sigma-70 family RNA polymerase sigma factor [Pirellulales bacterium]
MDERDFDCLIEHYPRIRRAALMLSNVDAWEADDLAQETMLQAARGWHAFNGASQVHTWLYSILLNQHRRRLRSKGRWWRSWMAWFDQKPGRHDAAPDKQIVAEEWRQSLWSAVAELPEAQKQAILLRYSEDFSYEQIAQVLQCPLGTVKSRLHHGLRALAKKLQNGDAAAAFAELTNR